MLQWMKGRADGPEASRPVARNAPSGIVAGTRIATEAGWQRAETLCAGDLVMTFDHGLQPLRSVSRRLCPGSSNGKSVSQPLVVLAPGAAGNAGTMLLLPGQGVILESDAAEEIYGDPFALLPGQALQELPEGTSMLSEAPVVAVTLSFEGDELAYADGQALLYCGGSTFDHPETLDDAVFGHPPRYRMLPIDAAVALTSSIARAAGAPSRQGAPAA